MSPLFTTGFFACQTHRRFASTAFGLKSTTLSCIYVKQILTFGLNSTIYNDWVKQIWNSRVLSAFAIVLRLSRSYQSKCSVNQIVVESSGVFLHDLLPAALVTPRNKHLRRPIIPDQLLHLHPCSGPRVPLSQTKLLVLKFMVRRRGRRECSTVAERPLPTEKTKKDRRTGEEDTRNRKRNQTFNFRSEFKKKSIAVREGVIFFGIVLRLVDGGLWVREKQRRHHVTLNLNRLFI